MPIATKKVLGRRKVHYESLQDLLNDAETLAASEVRTLGNWTFGQVLTHVAMALDSSIDGSGFMLPAPVRWLMTLFMKRKFLLQPIPPGFKSSERFIPNQTSVEDGLAALRAAIDRQNHETNRAPHPAFGQISNKEWNDFNLRHSEMHMSFVVPN